MGENRLQLDPHTERQFCELLADECHSKGFALRDGAVLHLHEMQRKQKSVMDGLKNRFGQYIDFEGGGLKVYEFDYKGEKGTFSIKPGWDKGGPNVMLQFHMKF